MRKPILAVVAILALIVVWYGAWRFIMADDVARIKTSIEYQNQQFKTVNRNMVLKAESVNPSGFPFGFRVSVKRATLSMIDGKETFAVSIPELLLESSDSDQGRYRVVLPATFDALYATDGAATENYTVTMDKVPNVALRAQGNSQQCSGFPGAKRCEPVNVDAPIISYAVQLPGTITLKMELNGESRSAVFNMMKVDIPVFMTIPTDVSGPLQLFVGVLREALVFKTKN